MNIKKLKINKNLKNKFKKLILKKVPMALTIISISATMILTGCFSPKMTTKVDNTKPTTYTQTAVENFNKTVDNPYETIDEFDYSNSNINIESNYYNEFVKYIDNIETNYEFEDYYHIDEALSKYNAVKDKKVSHHTHKINSITPESIYNQVKVNNKKYLEEKANKFVSKFYDEFNDSELKNICTIISDVLNLYIDNGKVSDVDELKCILGDLKVVIKNTMSNAYVTNDNCMVISPSMIKAFKLKAKSKNQDVFKDVVAHETIHLIQKNCPDTMEYKTAIGSSVKFDDLKVNSLYWDWFFEASAEKNSMNYTKDPATTYEYFINYMDSLSLSTVLYKDNYPSQILDSSLIKDFDPLFKTFKATTEEQKREIIKMMFSLDIIEEKNKEFYNEFNPNATEEDYVKVDRKLKNSVCETMTKSFYKSLAETVKDNNLKLNDIFYLITIFESDLNSHLGYMKEDRYNDVKPFVEKYINIQNEFFYLLSTSKKYSQEEIENIFNSYGTTNRSKQENYSLSFLKNDKKDFINEIINRYDKYNIEQVRDSLKKINVNY